MPFSRLVEQDSTLLSTIMMSLMSLPLRRRDRSLTQTIEDYLLITTHCFLQRMQSKYCQPLKVDNTIYAYYSEAAVKRISSKWFLRSARISYKQGLYIIWIYKLILTLTNDWLPLLSISFILVSYYPLRGSSSWALTRVSSKSKTNVFLSTAAVMTIKLHFDFF